jgi:RNA polymerase sigma-70 factor (ECF subfamily)
VYSHSPKNLAWRPHSIHVLTLHDDSIAALTMFLVPEIFGAFGLPAVPPATPAFPQP